MPPEALASVGSMLNPQSVALVGTSGDLSKFNGRILRYLLKHGYPGRIFPVNPRYTTLAGLPCYPGLGSIPTTPDCAVIMVGTERVPQAVQECLDVGVPVAMVLASGFAEQGDDEGRRRQAELREIVAGGRGRLRLLGPNCNGLINYGARVTLASTASLEAPDLQAGSLGFVSQSGGLGLASFTVLAAERRIKLKYNITTGNELDLKLEDFVEFMAQDPDVRAIACVIEGLREPQRFLEAARQAQAQGKPVITLKTGRSDSGAKAASSHTAALAGEYAVFGAVMKRQGIVVAEDLDEFLDAIQMFEVPNWPRTAKVGAVSLSGGFVTMLSDASEEEKVPFAKVTAATEQTIIRVLGRVPTMFNPLDVTASAVTGNVYLEGLDALAADPNVNAIAAVLTVSEEYEGLCRHIASVGQKVGKPLVTVWPGGSSLGPWCDWLREQGVPVFDTPRRAFRAFRRMAEIAEAMGRRSEAAPPLAPDLVKQVRGVLREAAAVASGSALSERQSKDVLAAAGLPIVMDGMAHSADEAVAIAQRVGHPVVLKVDSPDLPHKTEAGAVALGVKSAGEVAGRYAEICANALRYAPQARIMGVSVQRQIDDGMEVLLGAHRDPVFGPIVSVALGGVLTEALGDVAYGVPPITERYALEMVASLRGRALFGAFRGRPPRDVQALARTIVRLSQLVAALGADLSELDINPVFVLPEGQGVLIGDALIVAAPGPSL